MTIIFGRPVMARIPSTERIHKARRIEATSRKGRGNIPMAQLITRSINKNLIERFKYSF